MQNLLDDYTYLLELFSSKNIRFCDYYSGDLHGEEIIKYFLDVYSGADKEEIKNVFILYVVLKNIEQLLYNQKQFSLEELYELLNVSNYFEDILYGIELLQLEKELEKNKTDNITDILENGKYKIFFAGYSLKDISDLEKNIKKSFINKLSGELSQSDIITLSESIDHVKDLFDIPISRVQFANDYRIAYIRRENITIILGVAIKTGKNINYTRYDAVARKISEIYKEADLFKNNLLPDDSEHYKVVEVLSNFYKTIFS